MLIGNEQTTDSNNTDSNTTDLDGGSSDNDSTVDNTGQLDAGLVIEALVADLDCSDPQVEYCDYTICSYRDIVNEAYQNSFPLTDAYFRALKNCNENYMWCYAKVCPPGFIISENFDNQGQVDCIDEMDICTKKAMELWSSGQQDSNQHVDAGVDDEEGYNGDDASLDENVMPDVLVGTWIFTGYDEPKTVEFKKGGDLIRTGDWESGLSTIVGSWSLDSNGLTMSKSIGYDLDGEKSEFPKQSETVSIAIIDGMLYFSVLYRTKGKENESHLEGTWETVELFQSKGYKERQEFEFVVEENSFHSTLKNSFSIDDSNGIAQNYEDMTRGSGVVCQEDGMIICHTETDMGCDTIPEMRSIDAPNNAEVLLLGIRLTNDLIAFNRWLLADFTVEGFTKQD